MRDRRRWEQRHALDGQGLRPCPQVMADVRHKERAIRMACRGVLFAIIQDQAERLRSLGDDEALEYLQEEIEEHYFENEPERKAETDKAWDAIHRCLTDGKLEYENGSYPLNHTILGGELLYSGDDYIMSLKTPVQVKDIAGALAGVEESVFRENYNRINAEEYGPNHGDEDCGCTWEWFLELKPFWEKAASEGRFVLFSVDQ